MPVERAPRSHATALVRVTVPVMFYERKYVRVASSGACVCAGWPCDIRVFFFRGEFHAFCLGSQKVCAPSCLKLSCILIGWRPESVRVKPRNAKTEVHEP